MISNSQGQRILYGSHQFRQRNRWGVVLGITLLGVFLSARSQAATFTVNNPLDVVDAAPGNGVCETAPGNGVCTLRAAIQETNALAGADEIILPPNTYLLTIVSELGITGSLTFTGGDASTTIIDGNKSVRPNSRVLVAGSGITVNISGVTIRNGGTGGGGGGIFNVGTLTLTNSTVSGNNAGENGGGIYNSGTLTLTNSTVSGNNAGDGGGGIRNSGTLTLTNSTVSGNNAGGDGGGIYDFSGTANSFNSTITDNRSDADLNGTGIGGGVHNAAAATFTFQNTILAGNSETLRVGNFFVATTGECDGTIISSGNNLMENYDTSRCTVTGNPLLADPKLGPLQNNGGSTQTHALLASSPAIDAGDPGGCRDNLGALLTTDQRGFPRPAVGCDIGAYELLTATLTVASTNSTGGVAVTLSPSDNNGQGNGTTQFIRTYNNGVAVSLTASPTAPGGNSFSSWSGCDSLSGVGGVTCNVTMSTDRTVTAAYGFSISINDVTVREGDAGTKSAVFTVTLSRASNQNVTVNYSTANGTAIAGSDYMSQMGILTFIAGQTTKFITVSVMGDTVPEPNKTFFVNLTNPTGGFTIADGQGMGTIIDDDGVVSTNVVAAVLPSSRSVQVGTPATAFATIINAGAATAIACEISSITSMPAALTFQTTDSATNQLTGAPNTPVDIAPGGLQTFVFALMPTAPIASTDVQFTFDCANANAAPINSGVNTLPFSASATPVPDIVALAATLTNDGILNISGTNGTGAFAVATVNVGASGSITASADTGNATLPVNIFLCQTNPATGQCVSGIGSSVTTQINANATPTFGIFVEGSGNVPFDPAANRVFVRFRDGGSVTRGSTSVAVRTE